MTIGRLTELRLIWKVISDSEHGLHIIAGYVTDIESEMCV